WLQPATAPLANDRVIVARSRRDSRFYLASGACAGKPKRRETETPEAARFDRERRAGQRDACIAGKQARRKGIRTDEASYGGVLCRRVSLFLHQPPENELVCARRGCDEMPRCGVCAGALSIGAEA